MEDREKLLYRIWLNHCCDHDPMKVKRLLDTLGTPEEIFHTDLLKSKYIGKLRLGQRFRLNSNLDAAKRILEECDQKGIRAISVTDEDYPNCLKEVYAPPQVLYSIGRMPNFNRMLSVAVVGTRHGTEEGRRFSEILGRDLAQHGICVVSGMAAGMDAAAHRGALEAGGTTVAVLAGGVDVIYPKENADLYEHIMTHGCVVSEKPPGVVGKGYFYKQRNRIIVGLSCGVAVVEGKKESGTSITARLAIENNRDVYAVPGHPLNPMAQLANALITDGCKPLTDAMDIVEEYLALYPEKLAYGVTQIGKKVVGLSRDQKPKSRIRDRHDEQAATEESAAQAPSWTQEEFETWIQSRDFQEEEAEILRFLFQIGGTAEYDEIAEHCKTDTGILSSMLIILQMKKVVIPLAGGQYCLQTDNLEKMGG